jgi:membrane protease YdiL (CAAX protease family)
VRVRYSSFEFVLVIGIAFGWAILTSALSLLYGHTGGEAPSSGSTFGKGHLYGVVITELISIPVIAAVLYVRGWRLKDFPMGIGKAATGLGLFIAASAWVLNMVIYTGLEQLFPAMRAGLEGGEAYRPSDPPDFVAVYLVSIVNPVFEEIVVCGYVISTLSRRFGQSTAVNVSVVIRALYHLYQGIAALPFHIAYGLIQAYTYVRGGKLWPLIVSHAVLDFFALAHYI